MKSTRKSGKIHRQFRKTEYFSNSWQLETENLAKMLKKSEKYFGEKYLTHLFGGVCEFPDSSRNAIASLSNRGGPFLEINSTTRLISSSETQAP